MSAVLTLYVINLFDTKNVQNVWPQTGSADDDGFLGNPDTGGKLIEANGPQYVDFYRTLQLSYGRPSGALTFTDPYLYGPPRQIRLAVRLEY